MSRNLLVCIFLFAASVLDAQVNTATLLGTVKDSTGAAVPNASVTAKNLATGLDPLGHYRRSGQLRHVQSAGRTLFDRRQPVRASRRPQFRISSCRLRSRPP